MVMEKTRGIRVIRTVMVMTWFFNECRMDGKFIGAFSGSFNNNDELDKQTKGGEIDLTK